MLLRDFLEISFLILDIANIGCQGSPGGNGKDRFYFPRAFRE